MSQTDAAFTASRVNQVVPEVYDPKPSLGRRVDLKPETRGRDERGRDHEDDE